MIRKESTVLCCVYCPANAFAATVSPLHCCVGQRLSTISLAPPARGAQMHIVGCRTLVSADGAGNVIVWDVASSSIRETFASAG